MSALGDWPDDTRHSLARRFAHIWTARSHNHQPHGLRFPHGNDSADRRNRLAPAIGGRKRGNDIIVGGNNHRRDHAAGHFHDSGLDLDHSPNCLCRFDQRRDHDKRGIRQFQHRKPDRESCRADSFNRPEYRVAGPNLVGHDYRRIHQFCARLDGCELRGRYLRGWRGRRRCGSGHRVERDHRGRATGDRRRRATRPAGGYRKHGRAVRHSRSRIHRGDFPAHHHELRPAIGNDRHDCDDQRRQLRLNAAGEHSRPERRLCRPALAKPVGIVGRRGDSYGCGDGSDHRGEFGRVRRHFISFHREPGQQLSAFPHRPRQRP